MRRNQRAIQIGMPIGAILLALMIGAILIAAVGIDPFRAYGILIKGALGDFRSITDSLVKAIPLVFTGLAFAFAAKCSIWNIGAEGQLYMGAVAAIAVGVYLDGLPAFIHIPLTILAGAAAGGIWAGIAAYLKVRHGINEVINTIMLNYVGKLFASFLVYGPMIENPSKSPQSHLMLSSATLPTLFTGTKLHAGIIIAILACILVYFIGKKTVLGYRLSAVGYNCEASRFAGISIKRYMFTALLISGMLAGLTGAVEMMGTTQRLIIGFSPNYGSDGIAVALLGQLNPFGIFLSAFFLGALKIGANSMQRVALVPAQIISIIQGMIILFVIASGAFVRTLQNKANKKGVKADA